MTAVPILALVLTAAELAPLPPLADADRLCDRRTAVEGYHLACERLEAAERDCRLADLDSSLREYASGCYRAAQWRQELWSTLWDVTASQNSPLFRRQALAKLRLMLGEEAYQRGKLVDPY